jgi:hypothetical protein
MNAMNISNRIATPTIALLVFSFLSQFVGTLYSARETALPAVFEFLYPFASIGMICWWVRDDSRRVGVRWPLDLGMFLYAAWPVIVPYHLFKTRGLRGGYGILAFIGVLLAASAAGIIVAILLWS